MLKRFYITLTGLPQRERDRGLEILDGIRPITKGVFARAMFSFHTPLLTAEVTEKVLFLDWGILKSK